MAPEHFGKSHTPGIEGLSVFEQLYRERVESLQSRLEALSAKQKEYLKFYLERRIESRKLSAEQYKGRGLVQYWVEKLAPKVKEKRQEKTERAERKYNDYITETEQLKQEHFSDVPSEQITDLEQLTEGIKREIEYDWIGMMERREKIPDDYIGNVLLRLHDSL